DWRTAGRRVSFDPRKSLAHERRAPIADRVFAHPERLADLGAGPPANRQQDRPRPIGLRPICRTRQLLETAALVWRHIQWSLDRHDHLSESISEVNHASLPLANRH